MWKKRVTSGSFPVGDADKIQWLNGSDCLFAFVITRTNHKHISLLDFRSKSMVWYWPKKNQNHEYQRSVYDAIAGVGGSFFRPSSFNLVNCDCKSPLDFGDNLTQSS